ncbi:thioesterase family protein [Microbispora rosea]|uniref:acyl-CoA thioesterase n=1 Tax=Microbispora rosea TaxID=58117 RepID=UPI0034157AAC
MNEPVNDRAAYRHWRDVPTRWKDNDVYGHVNNVVHYSLMDTVINTWLIEEAGLDIHEGPAIGLCVESRCSYRASVSFPQVISVGLRIGHLGRSSVRYELALFARDTLVAEGDFTHVFVDRHTRRPVEIGPPLRPAMERLLLPSPPA